MDILSVNSNAMPVPDFDYITREEEARKALDYIEKFDVIEVDTEGTSLDPYTCQTTLLQIGIPGKAFVFDLRHKLPDVDIHGSLFESLLSGKRTLKILQNCNYDMKVLKVQYGYYIENVYDTMLAEQLLFLGIKQKGFGLAALVKKYLNMDMDKEPRGTFQEYYQKFTKEQLAYAATDVCALDVIRNMQLPRLKALSLMEVLKLEFDFLKPLAEMELNGIKLDVKKWRIMMRETEEEMLKLRARIEQALSDTQEQTTLFGVVTINIDSNAQLLEALNKLGIKLQSTDVEALSKYKGMPIIDDILKYRKMYKLVTTYGEAVIERINPKTGRLHTQFKQMVSTGRMSSNNPNLQNIPGKQKFRSCFIAGPGKVLVTDDMSGAELRIMGDMSEEPNFIKAYAEGLDLHTLNASNVYGVPYEEVLPEQRKASKAVTFGLCYGMTSAGLSKRLGIPLEQAEKIINAYFAANKQLAAWLDRTAKNAVKSGYSESISGRKRFYNIPGYDDPSRKRVVGAVMRKAKNAPIQGGNADTIKKAMIYCVNRLEKHGRGAKLLLTVHDEIIIECNEEDKKEVAEIVSSSLVDGFGYFFKKIPMVADAIIGPCWIKSECGNKIDGKECGGNEMVFVKDEKYGTKLVCKKCGASQE